MKFPKLSDLDRDQAKIYEGATVNGSILVMGPPGTGKTVIAFHRAHRLAKLKYCPRVVMYNKVLSKYASKREGVAKDVETTTLQSWVTSWWRNMSGRNQGFAPGIAGVSYSIDWSTMLKTAVQLIDAKKIESVNWGHLIIDEGQDFPPSMYAALGMLVQLINAQLPEQTCGLTVLADDNQRLQEGKNSTISEIQNLIGASEEKKTLFHLSKNYRNTRQIAEFASCFFVGLKSGIPALPTDEGELPIVSIAQAETHDKALGKFVAKIKRYCQSRLAEEIGVIVMRDEVRKKMVNRLQGKVEEYGYEIQSYTSKKDTDHSDVEALQFDTPSRITVLNYHSAKGLEFDAVFVIDPGSLFLAGGSSELHAQMTLYVMCSRARRFLNVMLANDSPNQKLFGWLDPIDGKFIKEPL